MSPACGCRARKGARAPPLNDEESRFRYSPSKAKEAAEAQRLGGLRRRRERAVCRAYDLGGLEALADIRWLVGIAVLDTLSLKNSVARSRTLAHLAQTALRVPQTQQAPPDDGNEALRTLVEAINSWDVSEPEGYLDP